MAITRTHLAYRIDLWTDDEKETPGPAAHIVQGYPAHTIMSAMA
jgi:hypothetical protein